MELTNVIVRVKDIILDMLTRVSVLSTNLNGKNFYRDVK